MFEPTIAPFNQKSWDAWQARGRVADAAFAHRVRILALGLATIAVLSATLWIL
jgi:hypothetical protein